MCGLTGCPSKEQKAASTAQTNLATQQTSASQFGLSDVESGIPSLTSFFQNLLSGNRGEVMDQIQPAVSSLTQQYEQGRVSENEFAPRGGGRTAADVSAPWEEEGQISTLVNNQENQNQTEGGIGLLDVNQLMESLAVGGAEGASSTLSSLTSSLNQQQQTSQEASQSTGAGIGSLIALLTT